MLGNVYITGATGLLGSELTHQLLSSGEAKRVVCLIRDKVPSSRFYSEGMDKKTCLIEGQMADVALHRRVISEYEIDTIFHLAAQPLVQVALKNPFETLESNVRGTYCLLEGIRTSGLTPELIVASSDKAYGALTEGEEYNEHHPLQGRFPYDVSKSCTDLIAQAYAHSYGLNIGITRCANFFGPGDLNESRLIPSAVMAYLNNERPIIRSDGTHIRDFIYVSDGAGAYRTLARHMKSNSLLGDAYNFSYGVRLSVLDIVQTIQRLMGSDLEPDIQNTAKSEIPVQCLNSDKSKTELNWEPSFGIEQGLIETIDWYKKKHQSQG